jgi:hypothetical protein
MAGGSKGPKAEARKDENTKNTRRVESQSDVYPIFLHFVLSCFRDPAFRPFGIPDVRLPIGAETRRIRLVENGSRSLEIGMKRAMAMTAAAILTPIAAILAGPDVPWIPDVKELAPYASFKRIADCQPGGQTVALAWGSRGNALGIYVFGPDGQCIGSDDALGERLDERVVSFVPVEAGPYEMVVRSLSGRSNPVQMAFRASGRGE